MSDATSAPPATDGRRCYRVSEVAKQLGVPVSTVHGWVRGGLLEHHKVGAGARRLVLIPADALEDLLATSRVPARKRAS